MSEDIARFMILEERYMPVSLLHVRLGGQVISCTDMCRHMGRGGPGFNTSLTDHSSAE
jgi:hypothetical protein